MIKEPIFSSSFWFLAENHLSYLFIGLSFSYTYFQLETNSTIFLILPCCSYICKAGNHAPYRIAPFTSNLCFRSVLHFRKTLDYLEKLFLEPFTYNTSFGSPDLHWSLSLPSLRLAQLRNSIWKIYISWKPTIQQIKNVFKYIRYEFIRICNFPGSQVVHQWWRKDSTKLTLFRLNLSDVIGCTNVFHHCCSLLQNKVDRKGSAFLWTISCLFSHQ